MYRNIKTPLLFLVAMLFILHHATAQSNKSNLSASLNGLPMNRAAFLYCYNTASVNTKTVSFGSKPLSSTATYADNVKKETPVVPENVCMFPNLTEDELWVQLNAQTKSVPTDLDVEIYNAEGMRVYHSRMEQNLHKINVCDFTSGTFLVKLGDAIQKLVIE